MNLLTDPLPGEVEIRGAQWPVRTDFRVGVRFELLMQDPAVTDAEKVRRALALYFPQLPPDLSGSLDALLWFYRCGRPSGGTGTGGGVHRRAYCFQQDAELIYAAFREAYRIDLGTELLHWWEFRALFAALPAECAFAKVMGCRTADTKGMPKAQKQFYERMKKLYVLQNEVDAQTALSLAERDRRMRVYVARRFAEAAAGEN